MPAALSFFPEKAQEGNINESELIDKSARAAEGIADLKSLINTVIDIWIVFSDPENISSETSKKQS